MAIPEFLREIRAVVGTRLLWMPTATAAVFDERERVLLGRRADNGEWALVGGIADPGEQPADTAVREVYEETGVHCAAERIVRVEALPPITYPNGDVCQYLDTLFRCRATSGTARVNDEESVEVGWFALDALPPLAAAEVERITAAAAPDGPAWFRAPGAA